MAGSPKKREREKAARLQAAEQNQEMAGNKPVPALVPHQDVLAPIKAPDITRTAEKRAMRAAAQQYAQDAMLVLKNALESPDERLRVTAANDILAWGFGKPAQEIEAGDGAHTITILRFAEE